MRFPESANAHKWLDGLRGIEIGASAHNPFGLNTINVDNDADPTSVFKKAEIDLCGEAARVDIVAEGDDLPFSIDKMDFVVSSHVIEHFVDPIKALGEWRRVASRFVYVIVPHPVRTFDFGRPNTTLAELIDRHFLGILPSGSSAEGHFSVWDLFAFQELCEFVGFKILESLDPDDKVGNGFSVCLGVNK